MSSLTFIPVDEIPLIRESLRAAFKTGKTADVAFRKKQLLQLVYMFKENAERFQDALFKDLGRPGLETSLNDFGPMINECMFAYKNIDSWAKPEKASFNPKWFAFSPKIYKQPKGVVLIITPFNFPLYSLAPLTGAIAAGCAVLIKPSELNPATSALFAELFPKYLDRELYRVVNGGVEETTKILELQWDHILYTGGGRVGRIVATAAAQHLTPVTLELGGKSPVIVDADVDVKLAARRILWGRMTNAGQTCIAPDYILVPQHAQAKLVAAFKETWADFFGPDPQKSDSFGRIISHNHWDRIAGILDNTQGDIVVGGQKNRDEKYIAPTIVQNVPFGDTLMKEEIFGPVLPIVPVPDVEAALSYVNSHDHPLSLYIFSNSAKFRKYVLRNTISGSVVENDVLLQGGVSEVPFGGVGASGYGAHKGKYSFDTFTHHRTALSSPAWIDLILGMRYPPYTAQSLKKANAMMPSIPPKNGRLSWKRWVALALGFAFLAANKERVLKFIRA